MHIPDGFLSARVAGTCVVLSTLSIGVALGRRGPDSLHRRVPLLGVTAAFVFVAQMVNFPLLAGTSGHLVGAVLATALLGIRPAMIVMTSVLVAQCLLFGDGGLLALGANVLNMGIVEPALGGLLIAALGGRSPDTRRRFAALGCAAWTATVMSALLGAGELALSRTAPPGALFLAMGGVHALIGLGEALLTVLIVAAVVRLRPELLDWEHASPLETRQAVAFGLVVSAGLAVFVAPFACEWPDGLDRVAQWFGFDQRAVGEHLAHPLLADYRLPGIHSPVVATGLASILGSIVVFWATWLLGRWLAVAPAPLTSEASPHRGPLASGEHAG